MVPNELARQHRAKIRMAIAFPLVGIAILTVLFVVQDFPQPFWIWGLLTATFIFFEWNTVEVNDKLFASPSVMVIMTAAVVFGPESAVLGCTAMAAAGLIQPEDIRNRHVVPAIGQFRSADYFVVVVHSRGVAHPVGD